MRSLLASKAFRPWLALWLVVFVITASSGGEKTQPEKGPSEDERYELYKLLVDTIDQVERNYVKEVDRRELFEAAIQGVLGKLDPYSAYISPEELKQFRSSVESEFGGIGIQIGVEDGHLKVLSPLVGTPAYRAGIVAGDWIVEIDGKSTKGISTEEAVKRLKGEAGTKVTLGIRSDGKSEKRAIEVARERIHVETVLGDHRGDDDAWRFLLDDESRIGYIRLTTFSRDTARELQQALEKLKSQNARGLILDLRFNPGGLLSAAIEVADLFLSEGRIVSTKGRNSPERVWDAKKNAVFEGVPMAILVNRYSASASEIVAACLQDNKRAVIVGERTWGKGSVQNVIDLEEGASALKLTTAAYRRPSGKNIHRFEDTEEDGEWGVLPDEGCQLKLDASELANLIQDRRERDIVRPHRTVSETADAQTNPPAKAAKEPDVPPRTVPDRQLELALKQLTAELARVD